MRVLLADDDGATRLVLGTSLKRWGYEVATAADGLSAWQALERDCPDIAILDWMMPGMNGIDLCRRLRASEHLNNIYIIIITARTKESDMVTGLESGADDYLIKPCSGDVLRCRVGIGARTIQYRQALERQNRELANYSSQMEKLVEERTRQLVHTDRIVTAGLLSAGIAHEINNPMTFISGNIQTLDLMWRDIEPELRREPPPIVPGGEARLCFLIDNFSDILDDMRKGVKRVTTIVNGLKAFCRQGDSRPVVCPVNPIVEQSLIFCHNLLKHSIEVITRLDPDTAPVLADPQQMEQVLVNLIVNAVHAMERRANSRLIIETSQQGDMVRISVMDNGPGISPDNIDAIWQPFFTTKPVGQGTGLGLPISLGIVERFGGTISVSNRDGGGAAFVIDLPATPEGVLT